MENKSAGRRILENTIKGFIYPQQLTNWAKESQSYWKKQGYDYNPIAFRSKKNYITARVVAQVFDIGKYFYLYFLGKNLVDLIK